MAGGADSCGAGGAEVAVEVESWLGHDGYDG